MAYSAIIGGTDGPTSIFIAGKLGNITCGWFNLFGLIMVICMMIPNIIFAIKCKEGFENYWYKKWLDILEQIGRFGCFGFMIINVPGTYAGFYSIEAYFIYHIIDIIVIAIYCLIWILCFKKYSVFRTLALSILPSFVFLFSGIMIQSWLLTIAAVIFAPCHIMISYQNEKYRPKQDRE